MLQFLSLNGAFKANILAWLDGAAGLGRNSAMSPYPGQSASVDWAYESLNDVGVCCNWREKTSHSRQSANVHYRFHSRTIISSQWTSSY